jgi:nucleotidyltransferase/DNA polymerase involved in DNA repair
MVDSAINWLFVDLNSYFASIEQELCPELRGQPIAILPIRVEAQTGCCIAVSYQATASGVKTGFSVADAKLLCPHIILVEARPRLYVEYHHRIAAAIERCIPIQQVMSCDEFACQLLGRERTPTDPTSPIRIDTGQASWKLPFEGRSPACQGLSPASLKCSHTTNGNWASDSSRPPVMFLSMLLLREGECSQTLCKATDRRVS